MAHNYPKWPKNDARIYALFPQFFLTEKAVSQTFLLLECMGIFRFLFSCSIISVSTFQLHSNMTFRAGLDAKLKGRQSDTKQDQMSGKRSTSLVLIVCKRKQQQSVVKLNLRPLCPVFSHEFRFQT